MAFAPTLATRNRFQGVSTDVVHPLSPLVAVVNQIERRVADMGEDLIVHWLYRGAAELLKSLPDYQEPETELTAAGSLATAFCFFFAGVPYPARRRIAAG